MNKISEAAQLADQFVLTHKVFVGDHGGRVVACRESTKYLSKGMGKFPVKEEYMHSTYIVYMPSRIQIEFVTIVLEKGIGETSVQS